MSKKDNKNISFNVGNFKVLKSGISLSEKNFIGFEDADYQTVSDLHKSNINLAVKNDVYFQGSTFIGYDENEIIEKTIKINNLHESNSNKEQDESEENQDMIKKLYVKSESNFEGDVVVNDKLFVGGNVFFNKEIFMPNPYVLENENISNKTELKITENSMSFITYKYLLKNILDNTKSSSNKKNISSIKFFNQNNLLTQSIVSINKQFLFNQIEINTFLLTYIIYFQNKIIEVKPIMDTFILINNEHNIFKLTIDEQN